MTKLLKILPFLIVFLSLTMGATALHAQVPGLSALTGGSDKKAETQSVTVNSAELKKLITTLESETARKELISNLKTLESAAVKPVEPGTEGAPAAEPAPESTIAPITQTLGVDNFTNRVISKYQRFLVRNDLNESTFGKTVLTTVLFFIGGILIFVTRRGATRLLYWFDRGVAWLDLPAARMRLYARVLRSVVTLLLMGLMLYTITLIWDFGHERNVQIAHWFRTAMGLIINIFFVVALATVAWEALNALIEMAFRRADGANSTRAKTIMPIVRNILFMVFTIMFTLVLLSELGINILPLMAGAGVVGVAVGFGAQTMVKDYLAGFTIVFEDLIRVGDVVKLGEVSGAVERITLRKIQIRGANNSVFTVPFSAISIIQNNTKDYSAFDWAFTVPFEADVDKVFGILKDVSKSMKDDPQFSGIMDEIEIWGVDTTTESGQIIKGRIKTAPGSQWSIQREYTKRKVAAFEKAGLPNAALPRSYQISQVITQPAPSAPQQ